MRNQSGLGIMGAAGLGAGLMFLLDPDLGTRRRAILRDKLISFTRLAAWAADKASRDLKNRVYGTVANTRSRFTDTSVSDDVLVERVRSQMGRAVSHAHAIQVRASEGTVTLIGEILSDEVNDLIRCVSAVKGVKRVDNRLNAHQQPGDISSLQGGHTRRGSPYALLQSNWPPAVRLIAGTCGAIASSIGFRRGGILGWVAGAAGITMMLAAVTKQSGRQIVNRAETGISKGSSRTKTIRFPGSQRKTG